VGVVPPDQMNPNIIPFLKNRYISKILITSSPRKQHKNIRSLPEIHSPILKRINQNKYISLSSKPRGKTFKKERDKKFKSKREMRKSDLQKFILIETY